MEYSPRQSYESFAHFGLDNEIKFESQSTPSFITSAFFTPRNPMRSTRITSDEYRTFNTPSRFQNPDWWQGYSKFPQHPFYRTTNQEYGGYKPIVHTMPTVYRTKSHEFTDMMRIGGNFRRRGFNTNTTELPSIRSSRPTLSMSFDQGNYVRRS